MAQRVHGNIKGLSPSELRLIGKLAERRHSREEIISFEYARELYSVASQIGRRIGLLLSRDGEVESVVVGTRELIYLPDIGRARGAEARLRRLRLVFSDLSRSEKVSIPSDIYADLEKLRLDMVAAIKPRNREMACTFAHLSCRADEAIEGSHTEQISDIGTFQRDFDLQEYMEMVEEELKGEQHRLSQQRSDTDAVLVGVYDRSRRDGESSIKELSELARTAGLSIIDTIVQRRELDPRTLLGKGKLQELMLRCLRSGAGLVVFDGELKPSQWRAITNATELKVIDRSMLILDIFGQRATTSDGRLQVELAQLRYNLPKLVEQDAGLSRLTGGIGGRGPGETKLELGRRRIRDRIAELERRIDKVAAQRAMRRQRRIDTELPLAALVGYTNVGKSSLFNALTKASVLAEDKLFATLSPAQRRLVFPVPAPFNDRVAVLSDTVGFIRDLPDELMNAFRATLEELQSAQLIVHVVDVSDPEFREHFHNVRSILGELELAEIPSVTVLNKADRVTEEYAASCARELSAHVVSAVTRKGLQQLKLEVYRRLFGELANESIETASES